MNIEQIQKAKLIKSFRKRAETNDTLKLQNKRKKFLDWLAIRSLPTQTKNIKAKYGAELQEVVEGFEVLELYQEGEETIKGKKEIYQYFNPLHNTRKKILTETCAEIDKLNIDESVKIFCTIIQELINKKIHFAVFYAEGQRSPHIRIYDFEELKGFWKNGVYVKLNPQQREKAQAQFWRKITPWAFHYLDPSVWEDRHNLQIEFAPHWRYGTSFELIMEWTN